MVWKPDGEVENPQRNSVKTVSPKIVISADMGLEDLGVHDGSYVDIIIKNSSRIKITVSIKTIDNSPNPCFYRLHNLQKEIDALNKKKIENFKFHLGWVCDEHKTSGHEFYFNCQDCRFLECASSEFRVGHETMRDRADIQRMVFNGEYKSESDYYLKTTNEK